MNAHRKDAKLRVRMCEKVNEHKEEGLRLSVAWVKGAHHSPREGADDEAGQAN